MNSNFTIQHFNSLAKVVSDSALVPIENKRKVIAYLAVVVLGARFEDLTEYFERTEDQIRASVTSYAVRLKKNTAFAKVMFGLTREYYVFQLLNKAA